MFAINRAKYCDKIPPSRYELESKFKLIIDLSNKLDLQHRQVKTIKQLYSNNLVELRKQISEEISVIFRYAPIEYGCNCEDILWKRNYYDCVKFFKNFHRTTNDLENQQLVLFRSHLISGIGHYHSLIVSFRKKFDLPHLDDVMFLPIISNQLPNYALNDSSFNIFGDHGTSKVVNIEKQNNDNDNDDDDDDDEQQQMIKRFDFDDDSDDDENNIDFDTDYIYNDKFKEILLFLVHRFYICIGDLARYYVDLFSEAETRFDDYYFHIASIYYKSASLLKPQLGMPYNKLGTLYANSFLGLDSLYYYFRCLNSKKSFIGIKENLKQTFEFVHKQFSDGKQKNSSQTNGISASTITEKNFQNDHELVQSTIIQMINIFLQLFRSIDELENDSQQIPVSKLLLDLYETLMLFRNALNIESKLESRLKPNRITVESIFQVISIIMILIDKTKMILKKANIEVNLGNINFTILQTNYLKGNMELRGNFLLYISYHYLFQTITMVIHRECEILKKMLYTSQNLMDDHPRIFKQKTMKKNRNKSDSNSDTIRKRYQYSQSFSSDYGDQLDETMSQLKNTAFQTIQDILDSSENEDDDEIMMYGDMSDAEYHLNQLNLNNDHYSSSDSKTFDQMLTFMYAESSTPIIKFFCDYLQSNSDFMDILQNMNVLLEYFEQFFQYLNLISEFDFRLLVNFKSYLERHFHTNKKNTNQLDKLHYLMDLFNFINKCSSYSVKDFKQMWPLSSEMAFMDLTEELSNFYKPLFNCQDDWSLMNLKNELSIEKSSYLSIRCLIIFGVKLALLSLDNGNFQLSIQHYDLSSVHNMKENKHVLFVYNLLQPIDSTSILKNDRYAVLVRKTTPEQQQLISFDCNDKEVENACSNNANQTNNNQTFNQNQNDENKNTSASTKSLYDLEKLPNLLIDPYVYLENLKQIKEIVQQKKAFLIVPKLVTDFLNNLKDKQISSAAEASDFLHEEFFRGSRMIRFIRNEDRLKLEMLDYPRNNVWRRTTDDENEWEHLKLKFNSTNKENSQDIALFYELLEHCHYLLVNKVLVNRKVPTIGVTYKYNEPNVRVILITNNLSKWPLNDLTMIAQTCGIDIETFDSYITKQNMRNHGKRKNAKFNKKNNRQSSTHNSRFSQMQKSSTHFKPIQFMANPEMSANRQVI